MAARRPAKIATTKKEKYVKLCPITGKEMTVIRYVGSEHPSGMYWVVLEDFDGSEQSIQRMIPTH